MGDVSDNHKANEKLYVHAQQANQYENWNLVKNTKEKYR